MIEGLQANFREFHYLAPVVFICGKHKSRIRDSLRHQLNKKFPGHYFFYAEDVWKVVSNDPKVNALDVEGELAALSDLVVLIVESPGTFAELGAFANNAALRPKLLPVLDDIFRNAQSFINTGPVRWVDQEKSGNKCIFTPFEPKFDGYREISRVISNIQKSGRPSARVANKDLKRLPKHLLFLLCDLVSLIGPAPIEHYEHILPIIIGGKPKLRIRTLMALATTLNLVKEENHQGRRYYHRPLTDGKTTVFQKISPSQLERARARVLCSQYQINEAKVAQDAIRSMRQA